MNTKEITQEQISALADSELSNAYVDTALAALRQTESRVSWDVYHQIGDVLRSDDMAFNMSADFTVRMMARLEMEPAMIAIAAPSVAMQTQVEQRIANGRAGSIAAASKHLVKRFGLPSMAAAAAVAAVAFIVVPQMMSGDHPIMLPTTSSQLAMASTTTSGSGMISAASTSNTTDAEILRDPRIDEYLLEHQRFSPALYNTAQYARSAAFTVDANN